MFYLFNPFLLAWQIDFIKYIFVAFSFFGAMLLIRFIVLRKGL